MNMKLEEQNRKALRKVDAAEKPIEKRKQLE
jgi:hypothetical protein